jgi:hypothetical protein
LQLDNLRGEEMKKLTILIIVVLAMIGYGEVRWLEQHTFTETPNVGVYGIGINNESILLGGSQRRSSSDYQSRIIEIDRATTTITKDSLYLYPYSYPSQWIVDIDDQFMVERTLGTSRGITAPWGITITRQEASDIAWQFRYDSTEVNRYFMPKCMCPDDEAIFIAGYSQDYDADLYFTSSASMLIIKIDLFGNVIRETSIDDSHQQTPIEIAELENNLFVVGYSSDLLSVSSPFVRCLDKDDGETRWLTYLDVRGTARSVVATEDYIFVCWNDSSGQANFSRLDHDGEVELTRHFEHNAISESALLAGNNKMLSVGHVGEKRWVAVFDSLGDILFEDTSRTGALYDICREDSLYFLAGDSANYPVVAQLLIVEGLEGFSDTKVENSSDFNIYPNPFNSTCSFAGDKGPIEIFDLAGRRITTIRNDCWSPSEKVESGIYLARQSGSKRTRKITYLK